KGPTPANTYRANMASHPVPPIDEQRNAQKAPGPVLAVERENERRETQRSVRVMAGAQIVIAVGVVLGFCYFAKLVLITIFTAVLIAFVLDPLVRLLQRIKIPRPWGSGLAILLLLGVLYGLSYFFYARALDFAQELPKVSGKIRQTIGKYQKDTQRLRQSTQQIVPESNEDNNAV